MHEKIAVIGGGSWATAIVKILTSNTSMVNWWIYEPEIIEHIKQFGHNPRFLSSVNLENEKLNISNNIEEVIHNADIVLFCFPAAFLDNVLNTFSADILQNKIIVSAIKGIVPQHNLIVSDYFNQKYGMDFNNFVLVSGPSHAEEVADEKLTYLTISSKDQEKATLISTYFANRYIKTTTSEDIFGIEYATVLKNIMAVASGICLGLGYGDNFQAVLTTNAIREIKRFVDTIYSTDRNIKNSVYLGDLLVTCYSKYSRNRIFGNMIGNGYSVKAAQLEMKMIAEGYFAVKGIQEINKKFNVDMPITNAVFNILYEGISPAVEMKILTNKLT